MGWENKIDEMTPEEIRTDIRDLEGAMPYVAADQADDFENRIAALKAALPDPG